jgi:hypothetical protein
MPLITSLNKQSVSAIESNAPAIFAIETNAGPFISLDIDVSSFDNAKTQKEGVSRTCKGYDGCTPIFSYLGTEGYLFNLELREGKQHCQKNPPLFVKKTLSCVRQLTDQTILMRLDSGKDSSDIFPDAKWGNIQFIIKRNLRRESPEKWVKLARHVEKKHKP